MGRIIGMALWAMKRLSNILKSKLNGVTFNNTGKLIPLAHELLGPGEFIYDYIIVLLSLFYI